MYEVQVAVVGRVATQVGFRTSASGIPVARFRLASTVRRFDQERRAWSDAHTSFYTVWAWRSLAANVSSSVGIGDPVLVQGQLRVREPEGEGQERRHFSADLLASAIGHDLSRGTSAFVRTSRAGASRPAAGITAAGMPEALPGAVTSGGAAPDGTTPGGTTPGGATAGGATPGIPEGVVPRQPPPP